MKYALLGTAGHIDHGKSALVTALTGIDPDRLPEEKKRGITIDLGFSHLALPGGVLGIVDVPGHEKFIRHMVAGAQGFDAAALVVAANEGVRPQTREHLHICDLLGISHGLVVLTKADLADNDTLSLAEEEVKEAVAGTFLERAPILRASSVTGRGIQDLKATLASILDSLPPRSHEGPFRLPIDRVFTIKGFGTVVTGSVISGRITVGDEAEVLPSMRRIKIRGLQSYGKDVHDVAIGQRAALNLQGVEKEDVERGETIVSPGFLEPIPRFYASVRLLAGSKKPVKDGMDVTLHIGTSRSRAGIRLLGPGPLLPGRGGYVSVMPDAPVSGMHGDRFIVRAFAWNQTIGGGVLLAPTPVRDRRPADDVVRELDTLARGGLREKILCLITAAGTGGIPEKKLSIGTRSFGDILHRTLKEVEREGKITSVGGGEFVPREPYESTGGMILSYLSGYHSRFPLKEGIHKEELRSALHPSPSERVFSHLLDGLRASGKIAFEGDLVRLSAHSVTVRGKDRELREKIVEVLRHKGLAPPSPEEISALLREDPGKVAALLRALTHEGELIRVKEGLFFIRENLSHLEERLVSFLKGKKEITTQEFKEMTGVTRKYTIPLAEYFDQKKITLRVGDKRVLRKAPEKNPLSPGGLSASGGGEEG